MVLQTSGGYIETAEPFGKAGAYAIQGYAAPFVRKIEGCYFNVVGLPVSRLFDMFAGLAAPGEDPARGKGAFENP